MEREEFTRRLTVATARLLAVTRTYVIDALPEAVTFAPAMRPWEDLVPLANLRVFDLCSTGSRISLDATEALRGAPQFVYTRVLL